MVQFSLLLPVGLLIIGLFILWWSSMLRQRKYDLELSRSEARYRSFFDNSPISLWEEDFSEVKGYLDRLAKSGVKDFKRYFENHPGEVTACAGKVKILDVNKATLKLFHAGTKKELFAGLGVVFGEEIHEAFIEELTAIAANQLSFESEDFNQSITGERKEIFLKWSVVPGHEIDYSKMLVSIVDMTERRSVDRALRESEKRYRDLVENISELYFVCDAQGMVVYGSPNFFSESGYQAEEITGRSFLRLVAPEDRTRVLAFYRARSSDGTLDTTCEFRGKRKDGRETWVEQSTRIIRGEEGSVHEYRNVVRDITERVRARDELASRERRFRALIEESSDIVFLLDAEGKYLYVSPSVTRMLGYQPEDLIGQNAIEYVHSVDAEIAQRLFLGASPETPRPVLSEFRYRQKNGTWRWVEGVRKNLLDDPSVRAVVVNIRDVTERRAAEELLREMPIRIINAQESERRRVARDLHDSVNQILSSVKFRMESIEERVPQKQRALRNVVVGARHSLDRAIQEVRRISQNLRPSELDDLGVVSAVRSMCEDFQKTTKIDVDLSFSKLPRQLTPELEVTLYRIIQEALTNVAKHSQATRLRIRCAREHAQLALKIKDNGKGFDGRETGAKPGKESGMGLLNIRERAAYVGGTATFHSALKKGMEISVHLPYGHHESKEVHP